MVTEGWLYSVYGRVIDFSDWYFSNSWETHTDNSAYSSISMNAWNALEMRLRIWAKGEISHEGNTLANVSFSNTLSHAACSRKLKLHEIPWYCYHSDTVLHQRHSLRDRLHTGVDGGSEHVVAHRLPYPSYGPCGIHRPFESIFPTTVSIRLT